MWRAVEVEVGGRWWVKSWRAVPGLEVEWWSEWVGAVEGGVTRGKAESGVSWGRVVACPGDVIG